MRPGEHGPHESLHDRWKRWSDMGVFAWITTGPVAEDPNDETIPIDATCPEAHRPAVLGVEPGPAVAVALMADEDVDVACLAHPGACGGEAWEEGEEEGGEAHRVVMRAGWLTGG